MSDWPWFKFNWMSRSNDALWLWIDMKIGRRWYVLIWRKKDTPYCYYSDDATPPMNDERGNNHGKWLFGARAV